MDGRLFSDAFLFLIHLYFGGNGREVLFHVVYCSATNHRAVRKVFWDHLRLIVREINVKCKYLPFSATERTFIKNFLLSFFIEFKQ